MDEYKAKAAQDISQTSFSNSLGDLKKNIEYLIGMERQSGSMDAATHLLQLAKSMCKHFIEDEHYNHRRWAEIQTYEA